MIKVTWVVMSVVTAFVEIFVLVLFREGVVFLERVLDTTVTSVFASTTGTTQYVAKRLTVQVQV